MEIGNVPQHSRAIRLDVHQNPPCKAPSPGFSKDPMTVRITHLNVPGRNGRELARHSERPIGAAIGTVNWTAVPKLDRNG